MYGTPDALLPPELGLGDEVPPNADGVDDTLSRLPDGGDPQNLSGFASGIPTPGTSNRAPGGDSAYELWACAFSRAWFEAGRCRWRHARNDHGVRPREEPTGAGFGGQSNWGGAGMQLQLSVTKGDDAVGDPDLTYIIEASTDLKNWSTDDTEVVIAPAQSGDHHCRIHRHGFPGAAPSAGRAAVIDRRKGIQTYPLADRARTPPPRIIVVCSKYFPLGTHLSALRAGSYALWDPAHWDGSF